MNETARGEGPIVTAYPRVDHQADLDFLLRLSQWNLAPWLEATGGTIVIPVAQNLITQITGRPDILLSAEPPEETLPRAMAALGWNAVARVGIRHAIEKTLIPCDPFFDISTTDTINRFAAEQLQTVERVAENWAQSQLRLIDFVAKRSLLIIGSGPLTAAKRHASIDAQPCPIILGTALFDAPLVNEMPPAILAMSDGAGQFGFTSAPFIDRVRQQLKRGAHLVVPQELGPLVTHIFGSDYHGRIHVMPMGGPEDDLWRTGRARPLANVLTTLGLPLAAILSPSGQAIETLGVSFEADPSEDRSKTSDHWDVTALSSSHLRTAMDVLATEPGSVLPHPDYIDTHYSRLRAMTDALAQQGVEVSGRVVTPMSAVDIGPPSISMKTAALPLIIAAIDHVEQWRHGYAMALVTGFALFSWVVVTAIGTGLGAILLILCVAVLLVTLGIGVVLRLRLRRWMLEYERRRRQIEARETAFISKRLAIIEDAIGLEKDMSPTPPEE